MMPKEALTDGAIRAEMLPGLGLGRVVRLLQRFTPDDFAQEPLPKGDALPVVLVLLVSCTWHALCSDSSILRRVALRRGLLRRDFPFTRVWMRLAVLGCGRA